MSCRSRIDFNVTYLCSLCFEHNFRQFALQSWKSLQHPFGGSQIRLIWGCQPSFGSSPCYISRVLWGPSLKLFTQRIQLEHVAGAIWRSLGMISEGLKRTAAKKKCFFDVWTTRHRDFFGDLTNITAWTKIGNFIYLLGLSTYSFSFSDVY